MHNEQSVTSRVVRQFGSASIWSGGTFTVNAGEKESRQLESAFLYKKRLQIFFERK